VSVEVQAAGERLGLLPGRAAFWPREAMLLVADAHLGKAAAFRQAGIPVPSGTTDENLRRLGALLRSCGAKRLVFLGDMLHSAVARRSSAEAFVQWRKEHADVAISLVRGNHDRRAGDPPREWGVECIDEPYIVHGLALCHLPRPVPGAYAIGGHVHPAAKLFGRGREHVRLPCFLFTGDYAILPAFGPFTGMADVEAAEGDRLYVVADDRVVEITSTP
jgi:DNA ligase-associated metallophosphoesterase